MIYKLYNLNTHTQQNMSSVRSLDLVLKNDGADDIKVSFSGNVQGFLDQASRYDMAITRLSIPISNLDVLLINENDENFYIQLENPYQLMGAELQSHLTFKNYLPSSSVKQILRPLDMVQSINKTLAKCHYDMSMYDYGIGNIDSYTLLNQDNYGGTNNSYNMPISVTKCMDKTAAVMLQITVNSTTDLFPVKLCNIYLDSPATGMSCLVASGIHLDVGKTYRFADHFLANQNAKLSSNYTLPDTDTNICEYSPIENFNSFAEHIANGTWVLKIYKCTDVTPGTNGQNINFTAVLNVAANAFIDREVMNPYLAPNVSINTSTGILTYRIQNLYFKQSIRFNIGNTLLDFMQITSSNQNGNYLCFEDISGALDYTIIEQIDAEIPRMQFLNQIDSIYISSQNLAIERDFTGASSINTDVLQRFLLADSSVNEFDKITYQTDASVMPWRRFTLMNDNFDRYEFSFVAHYKDNSEKQLYLKSGEIANFMVSFFLVR